MTAACQSSGKSHLLTIQPARARDPDAGKAETSFVNHARDKEPTKIDPAVTVDAANESCTESLSIDDRVKRLRVDVLNSTVSSEYPQPSREQVLDSCVERESLTTIADSSPTKNAEACGGETPANCCQELPHVTSYRNDDGVDNVAVKSVPLADDEMNQLADMFVHDQTTCAETPDEMDCAEQADVSTAGVNSCGSSSAFTLADELLKEVCTVIVAVVVVVRL